MGAGRDIYILFEATEESPREWHHFIASTSVRGVIDGFDKDKKASTIVVTLRRPTKSTAKEAASARHSKQYQKRKVAGKQPDKTIGAKRVTRMKRLGVPHRLMPRIETRTI
jgi:hypothetical protein